MSSELRALKRRLEELRSEPNQQGPSYEEKKGKHRIVEVDYREEIMWRQRSRIHWPAEGDGSTIFFHRKASMRKRKNIIDQLKRDDEATCDNDIETGEWLQIYIKIFILPRRRWEWRKYYLIYLVSLLMK